MRVELSADILVYTGRARGRQDRKRFKLNELDTRDERVEVVVPDGTYTMTSSYFLELFGESIRLLGGEGFSAKYNILGPAHVLKKVDDWIVRALREKRGLFGGDV